MSTHPERNTADQTTHSSIEALYEGDEISIDRCPPTEEDIEDARRLIAHFHPY